MTIDAQLAEHRGLVRVLAKRLAKRLPASVEADDLVQVGMLGLLQAIRRFDATRGDFVPYATRRIEGAMLDYLRQGDPLFRSTREIVNAGDAAARRLRNSLDRRPLESEVAAAIGVPLDEYQRALAGWATVTTVSLDGAHDAESDAASPFDALLWKERMSAIEHACQRLLEQDRIVLKGLLIDGRGLSEIAVDLGVTVGAMCHRRDRITRRLSAVLAGC